MHELLTINHTNQNGAIVVSNGDNSSLSLNLRQFLAIDDEKGRLTLRTGEPHGSTTIEFEILPTQEDQTVRVQLTTVHSFHLKGIPTSWIVVLKDNGKVSIQRTELPTGAVSGNDAQSSTDAESSKTVDESDGSGFNEDSCIVLDLSDESGSDEDSCIVLDLSDESGSNGNPDDAVDVSNESSPKSE